MKQKDCLAQPSFGSLFAIKYAIISFTPSGIINGKTAVTMAEINASIPPPRYTRANHNAPER